MRRRGVKSSSPSSAEVKIAMMMMLLVSFCIIGFNGGVYGYPMMVEVPEDSERCINYNIPQDEDAHMVFLAVHSAAAESEEGWINKQTKLEEHYLSKMLEITKFRVHTTLPRKFPGDTPEEIMKIQNEFLIEYDNELKSGLQVKITNPESSSSRTMDTYWNTPVVMNHIRRAVRNRDDSTPLQGYEICFTNGMSDYPVMLMMEAVTTDEIAGDDESEDGDDDKAGKSASFDGSHLTPLSEQLSESISAAKTVIKEMNYMQSREGRMRKTADSINARVRYFSYVSVIVLLVVTYLQVTYLKRYFRKKKLL